MAPQEHSADGEMIDRIVSAKEFSDASMRFCDRYALVADAGAEPEGSELFKGVLEAHELSTGLRLSTAAMTALDDSDHSAIFPRSLSLVLALEGRPSEFDPGNGRQKMVLSPGEAAFFSFSDEVETKGRYRGGDRCKSVLIQLRPGTIEEDSLAEYVETCVRASRITLLGASPRLAFLSERLFCHGHEGVVGRLLVESCVLELVASAIRTIGRDRIDGSGVRAGDTARMARVRDLILTEPGAAHTLKSLAREGGVSVSSLKTKFREVYGQSVCAFLLDVRMERARKGLEREGWTVTQAAHFSGYAHTSNFCTAFQRYFGFSPGRIGCRPGRGGAAKG